MNRIPRVLDASDYRHGQQRANRQPAWMSAPASEGRVNLIRTMISERPDVADFGARVLAHIEAGTLTTKMAIDAIEWLKGRPKAAEQPRRNDTVTVTEEGFYLYENEAFRVQRTKDGARLYAKKATATGWDYAGGKGVVFRLSPEMLMSAADIARFGVERQFCIECSTPLEDLTSQHIGIGPSCGPKIMGKEGYKAAKAHAIETYPEVAAFEAMKKVQAKARREARLAAAREEAAVA